MNTPMRDSRVDTSGFERQVHVVNGRSIVLYVAGQGELLVYFHGAGTFQGFQFLRRFTHRFRVVVPYHPGFGESEDQPKLTSIHDYVLHYLDLFELLKLVRFHLLGYSMGGRMAAEFAIQHADRLLKLVLACPAGLYVPGFPMANLAAVPPEEVMGYLVHDIEKVRHCLPVGKDEEFQAMRTREAAAMARVCGDEGLTNRHLGEWLHRVQVPTLVIWGKEERLIPTQHAHAWAAQLPMAHVEMFAGAGHLVLDESDEACDSALNFLQD